jgi:hypothetical protein
MSLPSWSHALRLSCADADAGMRAPRSGSSAERTEQLL